LSFPPFVEQVFGLRPWFSKLPDQPSFKHHCSRRRIPRNNGGKEKAINRFPRYTCGLELNLPA
jgi:hypothetical protein